MVAMTESEARNTAHRLGVVLEVFVPRRGRECFSKKSRSYAERRARMEPGLWLVLDDNDQFIVLRPVKPWENQYISL